MVNGDHQKRPALAAGPIQIAIAFIAGLVVARVLRPPGAAFATDDMLGLAAAVHDRFARTDRYIAEEIRGMRRLVREERDQLR